MGTVNDQAAASSRRLDLEEGSPWEESEGARSSRAILAELDRVGSCSRPIRIAAFRECAPEDDRVILIACRDRRAEVCPACSHTYKGDAWQLVASGMRGGKGVPLDIGMRPRVFVTLTAPSFGPVHSRPASETSSAPCHRSRFRQCRHGRTGDCLIHHEPGDPLLGQPICGGCFDYPGAVLWNAHVSALWQRTAMRLVRTIERNGDVGAGGFRLSYVKAAEFQRRGLVHLHLVLRADGGEGPESPPPGWATPELMIDALAQVVPRVTTSVPVFGSSGSKVIGWGAQMTGTELASGEPDDDRQLAVAAYVAKYATKTADSAGALTHRIRSVSEISALAVNDHQRRLVQTSWTLGGHPDLVDLRLRRCAHAFGYRGHVVSKSRRYSTTFAALREARAEYCKNSGKGGFEPDPDTRFGCAGRGYSDPALGMLAFRLAEVALKQRKPQVEGREGS